MSMMWFSDVAVCLVLSASIGGALYLWRASVIQAVTSGLAFGLLSLMFSLAAVASVVGENGSWGASALAMFVVMALVTPYTDTPLSSVPPGIVPANQPAVGYRLFVSRFLPLALVTGPAVLAAYLTAP